MSETKRHEGRIHDTIDVGDYGASFTVLVSGAERVGLQLHGSGVTTITSVTAQQAHDLGTLLLLAAEDARAAEQPPPVAAESSSPR